jgi:hypothetical protein
MSRARVHCRLTLLFVLFSFGFFAASAAGVRATTNPLDLTRIGIPPPVLTGTTCTDRTPGILVVSGEQFTPGGEVDVVLAGLGSTQPDLVRTVHATMPFFGPGGTADPALGFSPGGVIRAELGPYCGMTGMVWARDQPTATWSNGLAIGA